MFEKLNFLVAVGAFVLGAIVWWGKDLVFKSVTTFKEKINEDKFTSHDNRFNSLEKELDIVKEKQQTKILSIITLTDKLDNLVKDLTEFKKDQVERLNEFKKDHVSEVNGMKNTLQQNTLAIKELSTILNYLREDLIKNKD